MIADTLLLCSSTKWTQARRTIALIDGVQPDNSIPEPKIASLLASSGVVIDQQSMVFTDGFIQVLPPNGQLEPLDTQDFIFEFFFNGKVMPNFYFGYGSGCSSGAQFPYVYMGWKPNLWPYSFQVTPPDQPDNHFAIGIQQGRWAAWLNGQRIYSADAEEDRQGVVSSITFGTYSSPGFTGTSGGLRFTLGQVYDIDVLQISIPSRPLTAI